MDMFTAYEAWKKKKLGKFSSSNMHRLLSKSKTKGVLFGDAAITYINQVFSEILTGISSDEQYSGAIIKQFEWGRANEIEAVPLIEEAIGEKIEYYGVANPEFFLYNSFSGGSPDGIIPAKKVLEVKCPYNSEVHTRRLRAYKQGKGGLWLKENDKEAYAQLQFNMMCTKIDSGLFASYDPRATAFGDNRLVLLEVEKDHELCEEIDHRLQKAAEMINNELSLLKPSLLIASADEQGTIIVEQCAR